MRERFSNGETHKNVTNVGELIDELSHLPRELRVKQGFSPSVDLVVFNVRGADRHLAFEEGGDWDLSIDVLDQECELEELEGGGGLRDD